MNLAPDPAPASDNSELQNALQQSKPRFTYYGMTLLAYLPVAVFFLLTFDVDTFQRTGQYKYTDLLATGTALLFWPLACGAIAFRVCRKSNFAANVTTAVMIGLLSVGAIAQDIRLRDKAHATAMVQSAHDLIHQADDAHRRGNEELAMHTAGQTIDKFQAAGDLLKGRDQQTARFLSDLLRNRLELRKRYTAAVEKFTAAGGDAINESMSKADIKSRLTLLDEAIKAQAAVLDELSTVAQRMENRYRAIGYPKQEIASLVTEVKKSPKLREGIASLNEEREAMLQSRECIEILYKHYGRWQISASGLTLMPGIPSKDTQRLGELLAAFATRNARLEQLANASERED